MGVAYREGAEQAHHPKAPLVKGTHTTSYPVAGILLMVLLFDRFGHVH